MANLHETLLLFAWIVALLYFVTNYLTRYQIGGALPSLLSLVSLGYASLADAAVKPLIPALRSNWLVVHVMSYIVGYGAAATACMAGIVYLVRAGRLPAGDARLAQLDAFNHRFTALAFVFLTGGLSTGAVWANTAWGSYWSWDPKETWALITWLIYALSLHVRVYRGGQARQAVYLSLLGFGAMIFTFIGVNVLLGGLHSYR